MVLLACLMAILIIWRLIVPWKIHPGWKIALSVPVLAACFKYQIIHWLGGPMFFAPDLPAWILLPAAWGYAVVFLLFFGLLALEIVRLAVLLISVCRKELPEVRAEYARRFLKISLILVMAAVLLASAGVICGTSHPAVRELNLSFGHLPPEADGLRIAVLADIHADRVTRAVHIQRIVDSTNALKPDLIVILGDFVDGTVEQRGRELLPLRKLQAKHGVFAVPGNHEYYSGYADWMKYLSSIGIRMLENAHFRLPSGIWLVGVTDPAALRVGGTVPDLKKALRGIPESAFMLLLAHRPAQAQEAAGNGIAMQLSGHTHGGMIRGIDWIVAQFNGGFVSGLYDVNGMKLYVSNGTGIWNGFPVRLGRPSEITLLRLIGTRSLYGDNKAFTIP